MRERTEKTALDPTPWILEGGAAERAAALTVLLGAAPDAPEVQEARRLVMTEGPVPAILAAQLPDGHWVERDSFYTAKYSGTVWSLIILAELGADGADARVRAACEAILRDAQDPDSGGFSSQRSKRAGGGLHSMVAPCLTGNMVFALVRLGMLDDPRVRRGLDWITTYQRFDDGDGDAPTDWPYHIEMCWGRHTCHMGAVKALKALAEVPPERRTPAMQATVAAGAEYLLRHHVFKRSHDVAKVSKPGWKRFGFPLMYQTDALEILWILSRLDQAYLRDERAREARDLVAAKADARGRWKLEQTFNDKFLIPIETKGAPSRWVTLRGLAVLRAAGRPPMDE